MTTPREHGRVPAPRISRRRVLRAGLAAGGVGVATGCSPTPSDDRDPGAAPPGGDDARRPVVRFSFDRDLEGWSTSVSRPSTELSHDPDGWLLARDDLDVEVHSARARTPVDWTLTDRDNDGRVSLTVWIDGPAPSYDVTVELAWRGQGGDGRARSLPLSVPTAGPVDLDTWWDCRGTAPDDVLTRVLAVGVVVANPDRDRIEVRLRDVRQPPSTAPWGPPATGLALAFHARPPAALPAPVPLDRYQEVVLDKLSAAAQWGRDNARAVHIGEWAWPKESRTLALTPSDEQYAAMAEQWLRRADQLALPYTPWGESSYWSGSTSPATDYGSYPLSSFYCGGSTSDRPRVISETKPGAAPLLDHVDAVPGIPASINLVGMCFTYLRDGTEYSASNTGERGADYLTEAPESLAYLHDQGYRIFRLPFRWDRVMRAPDDPALDEEEWGYVEAGIDAVLELPDTAVVVDLHCAAKFWISPDPDDTSVPAVQHVVDGPTGVVTTDMLVAFWLLLSERLRDRSDRLIYEIANEPNATNPLLVKRWTQAVVTALREDGDDTFCLIPSYPFDSITRAFDEQNTPFPWIEDPAGTRRHAYTLHHYLDLQESGGYALTYDETLTYYENAATDQD